MWTRRLRLSGNDEKGITVRSGDRWLREERLRQAEVAYITDRARRPLEFWWAQTCEDQMALSSFMARANRGRWALRRDEYWGEVTQELLKQAKYRAVHDRVRDLQEVHQVRAEVLEVIMPKVVDGRKVFNVRPGTLEGMVTAFARLDKLADDKRDAVLTMIEPELTQEMMDSGATFTPDEYRAMGRFILERRMVKPQEGQGDGTQEGGEAEEEDGEQAREKGRQEKGRQENEGDEEGEDE